MGAPKKHEKKLVIASAVSRNIIAALRARANRENRTVSFVVRDILKTWLSQQQRVQ